MDESVNKNEDISTYDQSKIHFQLEINDVKSH